MKMHQIEIDDNVWNHLKMFAEPFTDTPNSVLNRLLFSESKKQGADTSTSPPIIIKGVPKALSQIFEVVYEMEINGYSRTEATKRVAKKRGTAPQTIIDKYCRQLNKRAYEIDRLFNEPDFMEFKELLKSKFVIHKGVIDIFFDTLKTGERFDKKEPDLSIDKLI